MMFLAASVLLQIVLVVHVIRNGRNQGWILAIVFFPLIGSVAYFIVEIMPTLGYNRHVRTARAQVVSMVDPERDLRRALDSALVADTAANQSAVGEAYAALCRHGDAVPYFRRALELGVGDDPATKFKLARSLFETGDAASALTLIEGLPEVRSVGESDRRLLMKARVLDHLDRKSEAEAIYADIVTRLPGEEARCRYAAILIERGEHRHAKVLLEEVQARMKRLDRAQRAPDAAMYDWAAKELTKLSA